MIVLLDADAAPTTGAGAYPKHPGRTYQATVTGEGAVSATVAIEVSNDDENFLTLATISLSGTGSATDGFGDDNPWSCVRARLTALSGSGAVVRVTMGM